MSIDTYVGRYWTGYEMGRDELVERGETSLSGRELRVAQSAKRLRPRQRRAGRLCRRLGRSPGDAEAGGVR